MPSLQFLRECGAQVVETRTTEGAVTIAFAENGTRITSTGPTPAHQWNTFVSNEDDTVTRTFDASSDQVEVLSGPPADALKKRMVTLLYPIDCEKKWKVIE